MQAIRKNPQSTRWCFTTNNPTPDHEAQIADIGRVAKYLVYGRETAPSTGTKHFQGFVIFDKKTTLPSIKLIFPPGTHLEIARASSVAAADYCKKENDFEEFGSVPVAGKTNRYDDFRDWVLTHGTRPTLAEVALEFPSIFMQSGRVQLFIDSIFPNVPEQPGEYRPYQQSLAELLDEPFADNRKIIFIVDPVGNAGKSWFVDKYHSLNYDRCQILSVGRREDLSFAVDERKSVFLFDLPRSSAEFLPYTILEQLKDRRLFSNKYESRMKMVNHGNPVKVVVFTNEYPDMKKLSHDRYMIIEWSNAPIFDN